MDKAPDAFRTISEVADELDVPQHVLRFWETRFPHIRPMKRGGGRRYYRPDDVALLRGIRHLLYGEGYTIRGVQRILKDSGVKFVQAVWAPDAPQPSRVADDERQPSESDGVSEAVLQAEVTHQRSEVDETDWPVPQPTAETISHDEEEGHLTLVAAHAVDGHSEQGRPSVLSAEAGMRVGSVVELAPGALSAERLQRLFGVLDELAECRRLLDAARTPED